MTIKTTGWTPEKRARMAALTKSQKPWCHSSGPKTEAGKAIVAQNALKHGFRSAEFMALSKLLTLQARYVRDILRNNSI